MSKHGPSPSFEAWKCPDCEHLQVDATDCEECSYGVDEEGWDSVMVRENAEGELVDVGKSRSV